MEIPNNFVVSGSNSGQAVVAHEDITDHKGAEESLQAMEERLQYLLCASPVILHSCKASADDIYPDTGGVGSLLPFRVACFH